MIEHDLVAIGFQRQGDGALRSPARVTLAPAGEFYRVTIEVSDGAALMCFVARVALKVQHGGEKP